MKGAAYEGYFSPYARVIEGHVLDFKPDKRRRHP